MDFKGGLSKEGLLYTTLQMLLYGSHLVSVCSFTSKSILLVAGPLPLKELRVPF